MFVSHPFKEEKQAHKRKGGNQQPKSPFTVLFSSKLALPPFYPYLPPLPHPPPTYSILYRSHNHLDDHFSSASLFKTLFILSITWRSFRSVAWSNAPQRWERERPETEAMHGSSITFHPPSPPRSPTPTPNCSSFMHAPVSFHSCSFSLLYCSPPLCPHFLAFSRSFITEGIYHPPVHLQPHNAFSATKHLTTHTYKLCKKKRLPCVSFQKQHGWHE